MSVYNAALDIGSWPLFFKVKRWQIALRARARSSSASPTCSSLSPTSSRNLEAFVTILTVTATPWMVIVGIHFLMDKGNYSPMDLHAFAMPGVRGQYWYSNGVNPRARRRLGVSESPSDSCSRRPACSPDRSRTP